MSASILVVEDDTDIATVLCDRLQAMGHHVLAVGDGRAALNTLEQLEPRIMLLDLNLPKLDGIEVLKQARTMWPNLPVIVMTAYGTIPKAVEAMKAGATDFFTKPFDNDILTFVIGKTLERGGLVRTVAALRSEVDKHYDTLVTASAAMQNIVHTAQKVAASESTVLLLGESGTGKDLLAHSIHNWSARRHQLFMPVNCVALPDELLESELFGHEKGAFTGASAQKLGKFEVANGGTVFLDEIGDMKPGLQAKLLRFLQNREFDRVGGTRPIRVNIRIIAATNQDLTRVVKTGAFREDLFFRLSVVPLTLPPLRDRAEDIPALAEYFLKKHCRGAKTPVMPISPAAMQALGAYPWPGNVRELQNAIERAVVLKTGDALMPEDFALQATKRVENSPAGMTIPFHDAVTRFKKQLVQRALLLSDGNKARAADMLGLQRTFLMRMIKNMGLREENKS